MKTGYTYEMRILRIEISNFRGITHGRRCFRQETKSLAQARHSNLEIA